jgi:hypothetical protein
MRGVAAVRTGIITGRVIRPVTDAGVVVFPWAVEDVGTAEGTVADLIATDTAVAMVQDTVADRVTMAVLRVRPMVQALVIPVKPGTIRPVVTQAVPAIVRQVDIRVARDMLRRVVLPAGPGMVLPLANRALPDLVLMDLIRVIAKTS